MSFQRCRNTGLFIIAMLLSCGLAFAGQAQSNHAQSRFEGWSSVIIAADWRDGDGETIEAFDNARRDLSVAFLSAGMPAGLHQSITLNPDKPDTVSPAKAMNQINTALMASSKGCLFYITSHGAPGEIVFGDSPGLTPAGLAVMLRRSCQTRPTVIVLSACYSGSFVDALKAPNRLIMTAARRDRPSFGCGAGETYPWFDACVLETLASADDFLALAQSTRSCVAQREADADIETPSEPQVFLGSEMQFRLPVLRFHRPSG